LPGEGRIGFLVLAAIWAAAALAVPSNRVLGVDGGEGPRMATLKTFGPVDARSLGQLRRRMDAGDADYGVLCADPPPGYSQPIGGVVAYEGYVSPSGVGYDIACGCKAVRTDLHADDLRPRLPRVMDEIVRRISFGFGRSNAEPVAHPVL